MEFAEAVELARAIRTRGGWYVTEIGPQSGQQLEDDRWSVSALCNLNWRYVHYWARHGAVKEWPQYADVAEEGARTRYSNHER
jgi:hypothetical protein